MQFEQGKLYLKSIKMKLVKNNHPFGNASLINWFFDDVLTKDAFHSDRTSSYASNVTNRPRTNILENEASFILELAIPGLNKSDFKIDLQKNILTISSEHSSEAEATEKKYTSREFNYTSFKRSFRLPENISLEDIKAEYTDGILSVTMAKKDEEKKHFQIEVK